MPERNARRYGKTRWIFDKPLLQFLGCRFMRRRYVFGEEFHLLYHPPLDDRVTLLAASGKRFAVQHFLVDLLVDEIAPLFGGWRRAALREPGYAHLAQIVL